MKIKQGPLAPELKQRIFAAFAKHAVQSTGMNGLSEEPVAFEMVEVDAVLGCVVVQYFWGQLHIKYLYVEEDCRGLGYATSLMQRALEYGKQRGCRFAFVETMSFQAPEFYQKLGFSIDFKRDGFDAGTSFYYLRKIL
ncbi:MAG: GNAT family N-acetyltransferase [Parachlamydiales bacterium]|nr:GNAT family N-acetyltransferase [Candidatus Acheromyda pituitae]